MLYYAEATFGTPERDAVLEVFDNGWLSGGVQTHEFEQKLAKAWGSKYAIAVNSGSSANFLAVQALGLPKGSKIITMAMGFPTTVSAIIYHGHIPIYVDCDIPSYTINLDQVEEVAKDADAIMFAHTLGNICDMDRLMEIVEKYDLKLIEDCCDAMGGKWDGKPIGTFGKMSTVSFYPAHHMTTFGEGGAVFTDDPNIYLKAKSMRDWGRACFCPPKVDNACGMRFANPPFDHKYYYINLGSNLKMNEASAAFGIQQLKRLPDFIKVRKENYQTLRDYLYDMDDRIILPESNPKADVSWFAFPLITKGDSKVHEKLEKDFGIQTRALFAGNLTKHPAYKNTGIEHGDLKNSNEVLNKAFFVGVGPRLSEQDMEYIGESILKSL